MQRYFVEQAARSGERFTLQKDDAHHMKNVMRMDVGDEILVLDGTGLFRCALEELDKQQAIARIVESSSIDTELPIRVTLAYALPKGDKIELVAQKATELGMNQLLIFESARSVSKWDAKKVPKKIERLEKIIKEAAEQSYRAHLPQVDYVTYDEVLQEAPQYTACLVAYEEAAKEGEATAFASTLARLQAGDSLLVVIGPEGGLTETEVTRLTDAGFLPASLGRRILRTETAPLYVLSAVSYHFELKG
ncbi:16S rRNA (uracil(1498)-N(3))-methyltransferase [Exiguobacterium sp. ERU656]|uniref:16S rRNA (uracil(1498)-N(3))-methyltransferase n=1 Tax=Exiguobacterium sp. ERU656 TaxID=2751217 RepID=UPI001BEB5193|nr:16S rRNA (uracil(1498)-N(3))-methyltransferase [Exiguobacterium sp. ERU656]